MFNWIYYFSFGVGDFVLFYIDVWNKVDINKKVGMLLLNDVDGNVICGVLIFVL